MTAQLAAEKTRAGQGFLIGAAIGSGSTALAAERGGADFLLAINAGRLRNMGAPSISCMLPVFDAGAMTESFAREELLAICKVPVLLGINAWGKNCVPAEIAERIRAAGFAGAVNFPSCMHYSHPMQQLLSRAGRGIEMEIEVLRAVKDAGMLTMFYCATRTQARLAADAGLDLVCLNLGWNVGGALGHRTRRTLEEAATAAREIGRHIKRINPEVRFLLEGGPIASAEDLARISALAPVDGYVGGSTFERMPLEVSVSEQIDAFRKAGGRRAPLDPESSRLAAWGRRQGFVGRSKALLKFLARLSALAKTRHPLLLILEQGIDPVAILDALQAGEARRGRYTLVTVDLAGEDFPTRARRLLFGQAGAEGQQPPLLGDPAVDLLVIHAGEKLPQGIQRRLARSLREERFRAPDTRRSIAIAPRVVLTSEITANQDPRTLGFDPALATLLEGWTLRAPPLRERIEDLPALLEALSAEMLGGGLSRKDFTAAALRQLAAHRWPGNEAELRSLLGALSGRGGGGQIQPREIAPLLQLPGGEEPDLRGEKDRIVDALWRHGFNRTRSAEALGISRKTLFNKIKKYGLDG